MLSCSVLAVCMALRSRRAGGASARWDALSRRPRDVSARGARRRGRADHLGRRACVRDRLAEGARPLRDSNARPFAAARRWAGR
eukprot:4469230-Prymnesium_polylepis.2